MGLIEFFILVVVTVLLAAFTVWVIGRFAPGTPPLVISIVWGVAALIIIVALAQALGLLGYNPKIPSLR